MFRPWARPAVVYHLAKIDTVDELGDPRYTFMGTNFGSTSLVLEDTHSYSIRFGHQLPSAGRQQPMAAPCTTST